MPIIQTDRVTLDRTTRHSTIAIGRGIDAETGDEVTFAADIRAMAPVANAMARGEIVDCQVEPWQVLSRKASQRRHQAGHPQPEGRGLARLGQATGRRAA